MGLFGIKGLSARTVPTQFWNDANKHNNKSSFVLIDKSFLFWHLYAWTGTKVYTKVINSSTFCNR